MIMIANILSAANVLINNNGELKLGDLGLMTSFEEKQQHSYNVVTLWYRYVIYMPYDIYAYERAHIYTHTHASVIRGEAAALL